MAYWLPFVITTCITNIVSFFCFICGKTMVNFRKGGSFYCSFISYSLFYLSCFILFNVLSGDIFSSLLTFYSSIKLLVKIKKTFGMHQLEVFDLSVYKSYVVVILCWPKDSATGPQCLVRFNCVTGNKFGDFLSLLRACFATVVGFITELLTD